MFSQTKAVPYVLSNLTRDDRSLAPSLNLEHGVISTKVEQKKRLDYLNLSIPEKKTSRIYSESFNFLASVLYEEHVREWRKRRFKSGNVIRHFTKLDSILLNGRIPPHQHFISIMFSMFKEKITDGFLLLELIKLCPGDSFFLPLVVMYTAPCVFQFFLHCVKLLGNESYKELQDVLPLNICGLRVSYLQMEILIHHGHRCCFSDQEILTDGLEDLSQELFNHSFYRTNISGLFCLKRLYFILLMCRALDDENVSERDGMLRVVKQLWRTMPQPFITSEEIKYTLGTLLPTEKTKYAEVFSVKFKEEFGDFAYTPRSLRHLCRCTIRNEINESGKLPEGVEQLPVPPCIKEYLLLENRLVNYLSEERDNSRMIRFYTLCLSPAENR